jgi:hypothetical protein
MRENRLVETGIAEVDREHCELLERIQFLRHDILMTDRGRAQLEVVRQLSAESWHFYATIHRILLS